MKAPADIWRKVHVNDWSVLDGYCTVRQLLFFRATAGRESNRCGLFRFSIADAADRLGVETGIALDHLTALAEAFGWQYDRQSRVLWLRTWWERNPHLCANESAVRGCIRDLQSLPRTPLLKAFVEVGVPTAGLDQYRFEEIVDDCVGTWWRAEGYSHGVRSPSQSTVPGDRRKAPSPAWVSGNRDGGGSGLKREENFQIQEEERAGQTDRRQPTGEFSAVGELAQRFGRRLP